MDGELTGAACVCDNIVWLPPTEALGRYGMVAPLGGD